MPQYRPDDRFEFRRRLDGLVYRFEPCAPREDRPAWKRTNLDIWLCWLAGKGWCTVDAAGAVNGRPWAIEVADQDDQPPEGEWLSKKADKSYVYDLVRLPAER